MSNLDFDSGVNTFIKLGIAIAIVGVIAGLSVLGTAGSTAFASMIATFYDMLPIVGIGIVAGLVFLAMNYARK